MAAAAEWVKLLHRATYGGAWDKPHVPITYGSFVKIKAVHIDGYVSCSNEALIDGNPWNECVNGAPSDSMDFTLQKNSDTVLQQPGYSQLPTSCEYPGARDGDIVCTVDVTLAPGDTLVPSWYEAWAGVTVSDNSGTHVIDLYGWRDDGVDNLLVHWAADEGTGTTLSDSSDLSPSVAGTASSADVWKSGMLTFATDADHVVGDATVTPGAALSLSAWVFWAPKEWPAQQTDLPCPFGLGANGPGPAGADNTGLFATFPSGKASADFGGSRLESGSAMTTQAWHHVVITQAAAVKSQGTRVYVDGQLQGSTLVNVNSVASPDAAPALAVGTPALSPAKPSGATYRTFWDGAVRDFRVHNHALQAGTVAEMYLASRRTYVRDDVLKLDGDNEYVLLPTLNLGGGALTVEAWVMLGSPDASGQALLDLSNAAEDTTIALRVDTETGKLAYTVDNRPWTTDHATLLSARPVPRYMWMRVAVVQDGATATLYLNGNVVGSRTDMPVPVAAARGQRYLGRSSLPATSTLVGYLDDVRVWTVARSAAEVGVGGGGAAAAITGDEAGLKFWYTFDPTPVTTAPLNRAEALVTTAIDASSTDGGGGADGTLRCSSGCVVPSTRPVARHGAVCGDGLRHAYEMCDDGNTANGDGCSAGCELEDDFVCMQPSPFVASMCQRGSEVFMAAGDASDADAAVWASKSVPSGGAWAVSTTAGLFGAGGIRVTADSGGATYATTPAFALQDGTTVRFQLAPQTATRFKDAVSAVVRFATSSATPALGDCAGDCTGKPTYTVCFNPGYTAPEYCDQVSHVAVGEWAAQTLEPRDLMVSKYGGDDVPATIVMQVGAYSGSGAGAVISNLDEIAVYQLADTGTCSTVRAVAAPALRSCYEHLLFKQANGEVATSGKYTIDRGAGAFDIYCDMTTAGGGWDVVSVFRNVNHMKFEDQRCDSLSSTCYGNINARSGVPDTQLGGRSDSEMLIKSTDSNLYTQLSGFSTSPTGSGMVATYMTQIHTVSTSSSCTIGSGPTPGTRHYCGSRAEGNSFKITGYAGWTPHDTKAGLYTWVRLGGWWIGDSNGGGSGSDHQTDTMYGSGVGVRYQHNTYVSATNFAMYYRSKSFARSAAELQGSFIERDGAVVASTSASGLTVAAWDETTAGSTVSTDSFLLGVDAAELSLVTWLGAVPTGHVVAGVLPKGFADPTAGNDLAVRTALASVGVSLPGDAMPANGGWAFIGRKGFPTATHGVANNWGMLESSSIEARRLFQCSAMTARLPENALAGTAAVGTVRSSGLHARSAVRVSGGADAGGPLEVDTATGQVKLAKGYLDRDAKAALSLEVSAEFPLYDSGWFLMRSGQGTGSFKELTHGLAMLPERSRVEVRVQALDGDNAGFKFAGAGAALQTDSRSNTYYGGVVFGYNSEKVRVWAPSLNGGSSEGTMINIGKGWGNEAHSQFSTSAMVNVRVFEDDQPDWDSGYFTFKSQQGSSSFKKVTHALGGYPSRVKVLVRAVDGNNLGYVFEGIGAAQTDDDYGEYGGLVFGYDDQEVWLWAPDKSNNQATGYIVHVTDGWAGNHEYQKSHTAEVRILAWKDRNTHDYESEWTEVVADNFKSFLEVTVPQADLGGAGAVIERAQVVLKATGGYALNFYFESMGMAQETGYDRWNHYGGSIMGHSDDTVRVWLPARDPRNKAYPSYGKAILILDGWGGEVNRMNQATAQARVRVWSKTNDYADDAATVTVEVVEVNDPPVVTDATVTLPENAAVDTVVGAGAFAVEDEETATAALSIRIVSGDPEGVFKIDAAGNLAVARAGVLDYDVQPSYTLLLVASDGVLSGAGVVVVNVLDVNNPPVLTGAAWEVEEESPVNTKVGVEPTVADADESDTLLFAIESGNVGDAFKIAACGGQLRVNKDVLDFEGATQLYTLNISVTDDGEPSYSDWALFQVTVTNKNDPPTCADDTRTVAENTPAGADPIGAVGLGGATDPDAGDELTWTLLYGDVDGAFALDADTGALTVRNDVTNFEVRPQYSLRVKVADKQGEVCEFTATVDITDANDAPVVAANQTFTVAEDAPTGAVVGTVASSDEDEGVGDTRTYAFAAATPTATTDAFALSTAGELTVKAGAGLDFEGATQAFPFYVEVTDNGGPGAAFPAKSVVSYQVISLLDANDMPEFTNAGGFAFSVAENSPAGTVVATLTATDQDDAVTGEPLSFALTAGWPTADAFVVDEWSGQVSVSGAVPLDFESGVTLYTVTATVTDSALAAVSVNLTLTVTNANDPPVVGCAIVAPYWVAHPGKDAMVNVVNFAGDNSTAWLFSTSMGDDVDACQAACEAEATCVAYTLYTTSFYEADFRGHCYGLPASAALGDDNEPHFSSRGTADVVASGQRRELCARYTVTENVAKATAVSPAAALTFTDQDGDSATFAVVAGDAAGAFTVDGSAFLVTDGAIDYEATPEYLLTLRATDDNAAPATTDVYVLVTVVNVNEPPVLAPRTLNVKKASTAGESVGGALMAVDPEGTAVTHTLTDGVKTAGVGDDVTSANVNTLFSIDATTGQVTVADETMFATYTEASTLNVTVTATDATGQATVTTFVVDVLEGNAAPVVAAGQSFSVPEHSALDVVVGTLVATDSDNDNMLYYLLPSGDPSATDFVYIREVDGTIKVGVAGALDHETTPTLTALAQVRDVNPTFASRTTTQTFTIVVTDVPEEPVCLDTNILLPELSADGTAAAQAVLCADPDVVGGQPDVLTFAITAGNDAGAFSVARASGENQAWTLTVADGLKLDFEAQLWHNLTLSVTDSTGLSTSFAVNVRLQDVPEPPSFSATPVGNLTVSEAEAPGFVLFDFAASDPDGDTLYWMQDVDALAMDGSKLVIGEVALDYENLQEYNVTVEVADRAPSVTGEFPEGTQRDVANFFVQVTNVNDLTITAVSLTELATAGGETIVFTGTNLGFTLPDTPATVTATYTQPGGGGASGTLTASGCSVTVPNTEITCTTVPGVGAGFVWTLTVNGESVVSPFPTSYLPPAITAVSQDNSSPTAGGEAVTITGTNFGADAGAVSAVYGQVLQYGAADCVITTPHTQVTCNTVPGAGAFHQWRLTVGGQASGWSGADHTTSYAVPDVSTLAITAADGVTAAATMQTTGGETVTVVGSNFGPGAVAGASATAAAHHVVTAEYGDNAGDGLWYAAACVVTTPHSQITCTTAPGVGAAHQWRVTVGGVTGALSGAVTTSYAPPSISLIRDSEGAVGASTRGGERVTLEGANFGPATPSAGRMAEFGATYGVQANGTHVETFTAASCTVVVPHRTMSCLTAVGTGAGFAWQVRVGDQLSPSFLPTFRSGAVEGTSYAAPIVSFFEAGSGSGSGGATSALAYDTEGGEVVQIHGRNFGVQPDAIQAISYTAPAIGATFVVDAAACAITTEHEVIECRTAVGAGGELEWRVIISGQASTNPITAYAVPTVTSITGADDVVTAARTDGGQNVTLHGANFGPPAGAVLPDGSTPGPFLEAVSYGKTGTEYVATQFEVVGHDEIRVTTVPGVGHDLKFIVRVAGQQSPLSAATLSYADPVITAVAPTEVSTNSPAKSPTIITVTGTNFGLLDRTASVTVSFGNPADGTLLGPLRVVDRTPMWEDKPTAAEHAPGAPHTVTFALPSSLGLRRGIVVHVNSEAGDVVSSAPEFLDFRTPFLDYAEVSTVAPLGLDPTNATRQEMEFIERELPGVELAAVRRLRLNGADMGPCAGLMGCRLDGWGADTGDNVGRTVLIQELNELLVPVGGFDAGHAKVYNWTHDVVELFTTVRYGAIKLQIDAQTYTAPGVATATATNLTQWSRSVRFVDFSPKVSNLAGATRTFSTAGGEVLEMEVLHLLTTTELEIRVANRSCPLVDDAGNVIPDAEVYDRVIRKPASEAITTDTTWLLRCRMPPGEGLRQFVVVYRDSQRSDGYPINYKAPTVASVSAVPTGEPHSNPVVVVDGAAAVTADTSGFEMRIEGTNFGLCPVVHFGLEMQVVSQEEVRGSYAAVKFCGADATPGAAMVPEHTSLTFPVPQGYGVGLKVLVVVAEQVPDPRTMEVRFAYNPPTVTALAVSTGQTFRGKPAGPTSGVVTGGGGGGIVTPVTITLTGNNFGIDGTAFGSHNPLELWMGDDGEDMMGFKVCDNARRSGADPHHVVMCDLPAGSGVGIDVEVTVAGYAKRRTQDLFNYLQPVVSTDIAVTPPYAATAARLLAGDGGGDGGGDGTPTPPPVASADAKRDGPTNGGTTVVLTGTNLGGLNRSHCVFAMWANSPKSPSDLVCNGEADFPGEGEVPFENIVSASHTHIEFKMPAGMGSRVIYLVIRGVVSPSGAPYRYDAPELVAMTPGNGTTDGGTKVTLTGKSLGAPEFSGVSVMEVQFHKYLCSYAQDANCKIVSHDHNEVVILSPTGLGVQRNVSITVRDANSTSASDADITLAWPFNYNPPEITFIVPNVADSVGDSIRVRGVNFGRTADAETAAEKLVAVVINDQPCTNVQRVDRFGEPALECTMEEDVVGAKNVSITVAGQDGFLDARKGVFFTECDKGFYGQTGEYCLPCPTGADCDGAFAEPRAQEGWYNLNTTLREEGRCHERRQHRDMCNYVVPCEPKEACIGDNHCAVGYRSTAPVYRCADCDEGYYRRAGECVECPDNPLLLVIGFLVAALCLCVAGYIMNKKAVNLAFLSIGVDYFQVLAMFANSRIQWPGIIKELFHSLSVFNLNLEITAPECSIPDLGYALKWSFAESLPLAAASMFAVWYVLLYLRKRVLLGRRKNLHRHASVLIAMLLVMFYYLYLYLTRTILDVFNCAPTDPPDGKTYLEVVFEECGVPGGLQMRLLPFAIIGLVAYTIGYPALVGLLLYKNRYKIMEDQLLRAQDRGATRLENPNAYSVRKRYHKLYYHFKPDYWYWLLVVILRKFLIAFTSLMFNKNPAFQLSVALLVMFGCYAAQVRNRPYMSMSERRQVLKDHHTAVQEGNAVHVQLAASLTTISARGKKRTRRRMEWGSDLSRLGAGKVGTAAVEYFWNYNTVEQVLLACAVLVNLSGVMFESNRFQSDYYTQQRDFVTFFVLFVIFFSMVYFAIVFISEVYTTCFPEGNFFSRRAAKKGRLQKKRLNPTGSTNPMVMAGGMQGGGKSGGRRGSVTTSGVNPMFIKQQQESNDLARVLEKEGLPSLAGWESVRNRVRELEAELTDMAAANRDLKLAAQNQQDNARPVAKAARSNRRRNRREFAGTRTAAAGAGGSRPRRARSAKKQSAATADAAEV